MTLEFLLRRLPIQRKLLVLTLAACGVILLLACAGACVAFGVGLFYADFLHLIRDLPGVVE